MDKATSLSAWHTPPLVKDAKAIGEYPIHYYLLPPDNRLCTPPVTPWAISLLKPAFIGCNTLALNPAVNAPNIPCFKSPLLPIMHIGDATLFLIGILFIPRLNVYAAGFLSGMIGSKGDLKQGILGALTALFYIFHQPRNCKYFQAHLPIPLTILLLY
jgi:hypothetical protein